MWQSLNIRVQLIIYMTLLVTLIEFSTLLVVNYLYQQDHQRYALEQAEALTKSINNDLLKVIVDPTTDTYADINHRITGFKKVTALRVVDSEMFAIYSYNRAIAGASNQTFDFKHFKLNQPYFSEHNLILKQPILSDGYALGYSIVSVDLSEFLETKKKHLLSLLIIFPLSLVLAFLISRRVSKTYTQPFSTLAESMEKNNIENNVFYPVQTPAQNEIGKLFSGYNKMIKTIKEATKRLKFQSEHDDLTSAYNRFYIEKRVKNQLKNETCSLNCLALIDLDQFSVINNSAGYLAGDELLKMITGYVTKLLPNNATLARIGGDDFYILIENTTEENATELVQNVIKNLSDFRFSWEGEAYTISASLGYVLFKPNQYTFEDLIKAANAAFQKAKSQGRSKIAMFSEGDQEVDRYHHEILIANDIKEALIKGRAKFELYAQAIVPLQYKTKKIGYEILIRMWDSQGNFVAPDDFLPTAERFQLMVEIDIYVLWNFLETVTANPEHIETLHTAHVNLAGSSLNNPDFQSKVKEAVEHFDFPWHKLELEVTETSAVGNFNQAKPFIEYLKKLGIGLALDDFGTGMSSFEYLKSLPFDIVKIDGSFIKDMHTDPSDKAVIRYIQEISALRNQQTVAEYIETEQDVIELTKIGIIYGQGYFLGKPKPLAEWLK